MMLDLFPAFTPFFSFAYSCLMSLLKYLEMLQRWWAIAFTFLNLLAVRLRPMFSSSPPSLSRSRLPTTPS